MILAALAVAAGSADRLVSDRLGVGLCTDGSLVSADGSLGLLWDPDGPEGPTPPGSDLLTPGYAYGEWFLRHEGGSFAMACPWAATDLELEWVAGTSAGLDWAIGSGSLEGLAVELRVALPAGADLVLWALELRAESDLRELAVAHSYDPDPDYAVDGGYETDNEAAADYVVGMGEDAGVAVALASLGGEGHYCSFCTDLDTLMAGADGSNADDSAMGVGVELGDLAAGERLRVQFAYGLGTDADRAVDLALEAAADEDWDDDGTERGSDCDDLDAAHAAGLPGACEELATTDADGDGVSPAEGDCDDSDPAVHPGASAQEGVADANCDGIPDADWTPALPEAVDQQTAVEGAGGGCAVAPPGGAWLLALLALRRRA